MPHDERSFSLADDVVIQEIDGEAVVLKLSDETAFALNETGADVAKLLRDGATIANVVDHLSRDYEGAKPDLERDVRDLMQQLRDRGLVVETRSVRRAT